MVRGKREKDKKTKREIEGKGGRLSHGKRREERMRSLGRGTKPKGGPPWAHLLRPKNTCQNI